MKNLNFLRLRAASARSYMEELAALRIRVFQDFPYLYEGTIEYERKYLETYFSASSSFIFLVRDGETVVGATTSIAAREEEESFKKPFIDYGLDVDKVFYFGESVLLKEYRGLGLGKMFFEERESFARSLRGITHLSFCGVVRTEHPAGYTPLDKFWKVMGFHKAEGLTTNYEWKDIGEDTPTKKLMQFWIKEIK